MIRPTVIDLNPVELNYYLFMISLNIYSGSYNSVDDLSTYICIPSKTKDINVFNIITNKDEAKTMVKHILCDCKCKFSSTMCNSNQKCNNETFQCNKCKNYDTCKKVSGKYLKSIADTSVIGCDEIIYVIDIVSTNMANTLLTNVRSTVC